MIAGRPQRASTIRRTSRKLAARLRIYRKRAAEFKAQHPTCERCGAPTTCVHHKGGREGWRLLFEPWWAASCDGCNELAETDTGAALAEGWLLPRSSAVDRYGPERAS